MDAPEKRMDSGKRVPKPLPRIRKIFSTKSGFEKPMKKDGKHGKMQHFSATLPTVEWRVESTGALRHLTNRVGWSKITL
jgi:hypothetical protein